MKRREASGRAERPHDAAPERANDWSPEQPPSEEMPRTTADDLTRAPDAPASTEVEGAAGDVGEAGYDLLDPRVVRDARSDDVVRRAGSEHPETTRFPRDSAEG